MADDEEEREGGDEVRFTVVCQSHDINAFGSSFRASELETGFFCRALCFFELLLLAFHITGGGRFRVRGLDLFLTKILLNITET